MDYLPDELHLGYIDYLDPHSLKAFSKSSNQMRGLSTDSQYWINRYRKSGLDVAVELAEAGLPRSVNDYLRLEQTEREFKGDPPLTDVARIKVLLESVEDWIRVRRLVSDTLRFMTNNPVNFFAIDSNHVRDVYSFYRRVPLTGVVKATRRANIYHVFAVDARLSMQQIDQDKDYGMINLDVDEPTALTFAIAGIRYSSTGSNAQLALRRRYESIASLTE